jgi:hypothetical protein
MQCRYCFGDDNDETMISPCRCRGTSQFSHRSCLDRYFTYYPDRICRVCDTTMEYVSPLDRVLPGFFVAALMSFVMASGASPFLKCVFGLGVLLLSSLLTLNVILTPVILSTTALIGFVFYWIQQDLKTTMIMIGIVGGILLLNTLLRYIEATLLLLFFVCVFVMAYLTLLTMALVPYLDAFGVAVLMMQFYLFWYSFVTLRPAVNRNRIRNE